MVESASKTASAKKASPQPAKASPPSAPASRTLHRNTTTGRILSPEAAAALPKGDVVAEVLQPNYSATLVNAQARAGGVRVTLDIDLPPEKVDILSAEGVKLRVGVNV